MNGRSRFALQDGRTMLAGAGVEGILDGPSSLSNLLGNLIQIDLIGSEHLLRVVQLLPGGR